MNWLSGACSTGPVPPDNLALRLIELQCIAALAQLEEVEANLATYRNVLPTNPLEYAALSERVENTSEEMRWIRDQVAKLVGRVESESPDRESSGPTTS